jgi:hypothetical protein
MVSAVRQITSVGGDIRKIARLLQKKAPPGHMLAYINQEEADLLKERGGSGKPHEDTGIPSFDEEGIGDAYQYTQEDYITPPAQFTPSVAEPSQPSAGQQQALEAADTSRYQPAYQNVEVATPTFATQPAVYGSDAATKTQYGAFGEAPTAPVTPSALQQKGDADLLGKVKSATGLSGETLGKLGLTGLQGLIGAYQANKAQQSGQAGKEELSSLAAPYKAQAQEMIGKAQRGELTPVAQQQLQAVQAQAAQGAERRGGVGAQQSMAQVEAFRQQLLQSQYDYGLKLSGIADNIMTGAIKVGMQADQYVNQLTSNYFSNMARIMGGSAPQVTGAPTTPTGG